MDGWKTILAFWVSTYFAEANCLFLRGLNEWKISTSTSLRIVFKESHCCPLMEKILHQLIWYIRRYPIIYKFYTCQVVSRISSINRTTSTDGELVLFWYVVVVWNCSEHIFPHGISKRSTNDSSQTTLSTKTLDERNSGDHHLGCTKLWKKRNVHHSTWDFLAGFLKRINVVSFLINISKWGLLGQLYNISTWGLSGHLIHWWRLWWSQGNQLCKVTSRYLDS